MPKRDPVSKVAIKQTTFTGTFWNIYLKDHEKKRPSLKGHDKTRPCQEDHKKKGTRLNGDHSWGKGAKIVRASRKRIRFIKSRRKEIKELLAILQRK